MGQAGVRGIVALNTLRFVRERFGAPAHERVLASLDPGLRRRLEAPLRPAAFTPLDDVIAYMTAAARLLAPDAEDFFRDMGRFSGRLLVSDGGIGPMVTSEQTAARTAPMLWRHLHDTGRAEVVRHTGSETVVRVHGFPARAEHCRRIRGALEGALEQAGAAVEVEENCCAAAGADYCEFRVHWPDGR